MGGQGPLGEEQLVEVQGPSGSRLLVQGALVPLLEAEAAAVSEVGAARVARAGLVRQKACLGARLSRLGARTR